MVVTRPTFPASINSPAISGSQVSRDHEAAASSGETWGVLTAKERKRGLHPTEGNKVAQKYVPEVRRAWGRRRCGGAVWRWGPAGATRHSLLLRADRCEGARQGGGPVLSPGRRRLGRFGWSPLLGVPGLQGTALRDACSEARAPRRPRSGTSLALPVPTEWPAALREARVPTRETGWVENRLGPPDVSSFLPESRRWQPRSSRGL